jgi:murein DD-endopeptidase MepM/ murein hydrolase activator NlpD
MISLALLTLVAVPSLDVDAGAGVFTGRVARIDVKAPSPIASIDGTLAKKPIIALPASADGAHWLVLAPMDIEWRPTTAPLVLNATLADGAKLTFDERIAVEKAPYNESKLTVDKQFNAPSKAQQDRAHKESKTFDEALAHGTGERLWRGTFAKPVPGEETSPFGTRRTYYSDKGPTKHNRHYGWDLEGKIGDIISAANRGRVVLAADRFYSGGTVILDHGQGLFTMYFHMSRIDVQEGDVVEKGQHLGAVGASGQVTGPHLHFSVKLDGL